MEFDKEITFYVNLNPLWNIVLNCSDVESRAVHLCTQQKEKLSGRVTD